MFKCTECGSEFKEKPDYCDCGNDTFVSVETKPEEKPKNEPIKKQEQKAEEVSVQEVSEKLVQPRSYISKTDPFSLGIFILCIMLSIFIIFGWKIKEIPQIEASDLQNSFVNIEKQIPTIDKLWNDVLPAVSEPIKIEEAVKKEVKQVVKTVQKVTTDTKSTNNTQKSQPKQTVVTLQKPQSAKTSVQQSKTEAQKAEETRKIAEENARKLAEVRKQAEDLQKSMADRQEWANYKTNLRNTIGRKIDFTKVVGDGECIISFKINTMGRLVNASFTQQSSNITLNDAVYSAFMASRNFNPPPALYKDEFLNLKIKFYNGNFEITLQ